MSEGRRCAGRLDDRLRRAAGHLALAAAAAGGLVAVAEHPSAHDRWLSRPDVWTTCGRRAELSSRAL